MSKSYWFQFWFKLLCNDDRFSKCFKSYLVHIFFSNIFKENKSCGHVMKNNFNKELAMSKKENEDFESSTKCWIFENTFVEGYV